jgi:hypothetical protein
MEIKINIKDCSHCPHFESERVYTADSFEMPFEWKCIKADNRVISSFVEWHDKVKIPDWCPCRIKTDNTESIYKKILKCEKVYLDNKLIKDRYGKEELTPTTADIRDAEIVSYFEYTTALYLKTK